MNPAARAPLGTTDVQVTRLGLGTVPIGGWGGAVAEDEAHAIIRRSYQLGLRLIDTAPLYGFGVAERRIGDVLPEFPREEIVLATKVGRLVRPITFTHKVRQVLWQAASGKTDGVKLVAFKSRRVLQRLFSRDADRAR